MKRILITGGCGFVGLNLVNHLLDKTFWEINILDNLSEGKFEDLKKISNYDSKRISFIKGDIRNKNDVKKAVNQCQLIVHLAAQTGVVPSQKDPLLDAEVNILGTLNLLEKSKNQNIKRFVFASSASPLGKQDMPLDENKVPRPLAPYGASKLAGEGYCSAYSGSFDLNTVALRFSNIYGPWSYQKGSVVAKFIKQILDKKPVTIYGDGNQTRDFVYVDDICQAIFLALTKELPEKYNLFQLGTGKETSISELYKLLKPIAEKNSIKVKKEIGGEQPKGDMQRNYADITKARKLLGYNPKMELKKGLEYTFDWFMKNYM